ncbi:NAD-dependent epimerase/dehydratase family protein, partial [Xanthomonas sp. WCS2017Cala2-12]|uniref:NAD-dependent epimerase/dehydratase family protein n=1 Tax=Xanthomonas sp. WCS2017Cala2-12 TaxID=3073639 RepID=UPI00288B8824
ILLLGGSGFIGTNILDFIQKNDEFSNFRFVVLARNIPNDKIDNIEYISGDYGDKEVLSQLFSQWNFTKV